MLNYIRAALIILSVFVSVYVGILMNRRDVESLRVDINRQFDSVNSRLTRIEDDQKHFFAVTS